MPLNLRDADTLLIRLEVIVRDDAFLQDVLRMLRDTLVEDTLKDDPESKNLEPRLSQWEERIRIYLDLRETGQNLHQRYQTGRFMMITRPEIERYLRACKNFFEMLPGEEKNALPDVRSSRLFQQYSTLQSVVFRLPPPKRLHSDRIRRYSRI